MMATDTSPLAEALTIEIESIALRLEAVVVMDSRKEMDGIYKQLRYASRCLEATLAPPSQTSEEDGCEVVEQYGTSTNAGGVR